MKFGLVMHDKTHNLGDDIQSYAIAQFMPRIDYFMDREHLNEFQSENNEPVAAIFAAWWMWQKWNWPPADCIIPLFVSMHINNYGIDNRSSPITTEWIEKGPGREYFEAYGPVGVRDLPSLEFLTNNGIPTYFSGCITLTLPKQRETPDKDQYIVIADLNDTLKAKVYEWLADCDLEIREVTHNTDKHNAELSFEERYKNAEDLLTLYQNAKFVVTRRLHVTLPCLAMGVPVVSIVDMDHPGNITRWKPYSEWTNYMLTDKQVKSKGIPFDWREFPENKNLHLETRNALIEKIQSFVSEMEALGDVPLEQVRKTTYTAEELHNFRYELRYVTCEKWLPLSRRITRENAEFRRQPKLEKKLTQQLEKEKAAHAATQKLLEETKKEAARKRKIEEEYKIKAIKKRNAVIFGLSGLVGALLIIIALLIIFE